MSSYLNGTIAIEKNNNEKGMGFIISKFIKSRSETYYYIVTAKHVVGQSTTVKVYYDKVSTPAIGTVVQTSEEFDVALLQVPTNDFDWIPLPYLTDSRINDPLWFTIKTTSERRILPVYGAEGHVLTSASIKQLNARLTGVNTGCSGGPLIGKKGIVGMITDIQIDGQTLALPIKIIWQLVKKEWDEPWDLPIAERDMEKSSVSYSQEHEVKIATVHATYSDINRQLMIDGDTTTYWYSRSAPSNRIMKSYIDFLLEKPTKVTAIAVFIPRGTQYKYFNLVSEPFGEEDIRAGFGMYEPKNLYETRRIKYTALKTEPAGTWYGCRFSQPPHITQTVSFTLSIEGGDPIRQYGRVDEVKIWGETVEVKDDADKEQVEQIVLTNSTITKVNSDPNQGHYLTDGILESNIYVNLNDTQRPKLEPTIELELPESYAITHLRIHNSGNSAYGTIRRLLPYYDGLAGNEILLKGKQGWEQVALQPRLQARSIKFIIKDGWDTYSDQKTIQLSEIQLLGRQLINVDVKVKKILRPYPLAGAQSMLNPRGAYQIINDITNDGWYSGIDKTKPIRFDIFLQTPASIEGIRIFNKQGEKGLGKVLVTFGNNESESIQFRGIPGWEEVLFQHPVKTDIVHFTAKEMDTPSFNVHEVQLLSSETALPPRIGSERNPGKITSSSQYNDYHSPAKANDATISTSWSPAPVNTYEPWLLFDFGKEVEVSQLGLSNQPDNNAVTQLRLEFSDGSKSERYVLKGFNRLTELIPLTRTHNIRWVKVIFEKWYPSTNQLIFSINELTFYGH
ncbi:discoidin domain-containing protein [Larkinella knui]|nr:discoidin domain-containing protein [Larkinella knui]